MEPRYNEGTKDWQNQFAITRSLHIFYFSWGKEFVIPRFSLYRIEVRYIEVSLYRGWLYRGFRYVEVGYIEVFVI